MKRFMGLMVGLALSGCSSPARILQGELGGLTFSDAQHGWAVGEARGKEDVKKVFVASSQDGGKHWKTLKMDSGNSGAILNAIAFRDPTHGWVVGSHALCFETTDGGQNWQQARALGDARNLHYRNGLGCLVLGTFGYSHRNGVITFQGEDMEKGRAVSRIPGGRIVDPYDIQILDDKTLWGYGSAELYNSNDQGLNWKVTELNECKDGSNLVKGLRTAFFVSPTQGWLCLEDGSLLTTNDGGATRTPLSPTGMEGLVVEQLYFFDAVNGLALATGGRTRSGRNQVMLTRDGGQSWKKQLDLGEGTWHRLVVLDRSHAWAGGQVHGQVTIVPFSP